MKIAYTRRALKEISALNEPRKSKIQTAIEELPEGDVKRLANLGNLHRLRIGIYRVVFEKISEDEIEIIRVAPRGQAYKGL